MAVTLDLMEYANDGAAQAAYASSDSNYTADRIPTMTSNTAPSGVASADTELGIFLAYKGMKDDNSDGVCWISNNAAFPRYLQYQFTSGKTVQRYTITSRNDPAILYPIDWTLRGSNNGTDWDTLDTQTSQSFTQDETKTYSFTNSVSYTYYRLNITDGSGTGGDYNYTAVGELELMEVVLQCYSEDTIVQQGTYSLKGTAVITDSLNETLTRSGLAIDLSGLYDIHLYIRALRTGSHIKIGIHDSGGVTTEVTPNIASANTWQEVILDISGVADADKDDIDSIIVTIVNADADNTFYLDDIFGMSTAERERSIVYDSILELSKTRDIVYDSVLELSKTRDILYDSVLELSRERSILYDSILELSRERNIVYDAILWIGQERNIVYDLVLELSRERNILYDSILEVSKERSILYDLFELVQRMEAPTGVWVKQDRPSGVAVRQDRPTGVSAKQTVPSDGAVKQDRPSGTSTKLDEP